MNTLIFNADDLAMTPGTKRFITVIGYILFMSTLFLTIYSLWIALFTDEAVPGWASTVLPIYFLGGVQMLSIGIIGEYIGKIYLEVKAHAHVILLKKRHRLCLLNMYFTTGK